jgi:type I restriction enzyme R subunit
VTARSDGGLSHFAFLQREWPDVFDASVRAEGVLHADPRTACFYARRALELTVAWTYKHDAALKLPYQDNLSALIHEPSFKQAAGEAVFSKARVINTLAIPFDDALVAVRELFHVCYWLARTYSRAERPAPGLVFDATKLPAPAAAAKQTAEQLQQLEAALRERDEKLVAVLADRTALDDELKRLRSGRGQEGCGRAAGHSRLFGSGNSRLLHRPAAQGSRLVARSEARSGVRDRRNAEQSG